MNLKQKAVDGFRWTGFASIISFGIGLIQIAIVTRYLTAEEIGIISLVMVVLGVARVFSDGGMSNSLVHFQNLDTNQISSLYWLNILLSFIVAALLYLNAQLIANIFDSDSLAIYIKAVSITIIIAAVGQQYYVLLKRDLHFKTISFIDLGQKIVVFISTVILLVVYKFGVLSIIYATIIGTLFYSISSLIIGVRLFNWPRLVELNLSSIIECIKFGSYQMAGRSVGYVSSNLDKLFIGKFFGMHILGFYELATILINRPISVINPIFNTVSFPLFSKIQEDHPRLNQWYLKKISFISLVTAAVYCGLYAVKHELVSVMFGIGWELTVASFSILCILGYFKSISNPIGSYILALGKPDYSLYFNVYQICVHFILLWIGVSYFDYLAAISIYVAGAIILTVPGEYFLRYTLTKMDVLSHVKIISRHLLFGLIMTGLVIFINSVFTQSPSEMIRLVILAVIGAAIYFLINFSFNRSLLNELYTLLRNKEEV